MIFYSCSFGKKRRTIALLFFFPEVSLSGPRGYILEWRMNLFPDCDDNQGIVSGMAGNARGIT
jgi:hypothetical protein